MAYELYDGALPFIAASAINAQGVVGLVDGDVERRVVPLATVNVEPIGPAIATAANPDDAVSVVPIGRVVRAWAAASIGHGADVGVVGATTSLGPVAGASGSVVYAVGKALSAADAGEAFSYYINPRQLSGMP